MSHHLDSAHRFFPNVLPYTVGTPAAFGFAGWNGRSLTDNALNVMFSIAANTPVALGIGKESVTRLFLTYPLPPKQISSGAHRVVIEIQSQYAQTSFDVYVAKMSKLSEMYVAIALDASKPIAQAPIKRDT